MAFRESYPKISHEVPKDLFKFHDLINDYPYVLGHLLKLDKEYADFYKEKLKHADYSILDNSAFELGASIPMEELYELGKEYKPTHLVLPDVVNDYKTTVDNAKEFFSKYKVEGQNYIGVAQGVTFEELKESIKYYVSQEVKIIALPFDIIPGTDWITGRFRFMQWLDTQRDIDDSDFKYHLLGCLNPVEFKLYNSRYGGHDYNIYSVDTSSPIINGWVGNRLDSVHGLQTDKPKEKLADNLDIKLDDNQIKLIFENVKTFKNYFVHDKKW